MESALQTIKQHNMLKQGEIIGVAVSGGQDSMSLLHFLDTIKEDYDVEIVAVNIDHSLRENSAADSAFVARWCREHHIRCFKFKVDSNSIAKTKKISIEAAAREARYGVFDTLLKKGMVDKIALGHHMSDQAETILMHILRGSGLNGLKGMEFIRQNVYIRPFLATEKSEIIAYQYKNEIEYVEDETNADPRYQRNYIRHRIMPLIRSEWRGADKTLIGFSELARQDDAFIEQFVDTGGFYKQENLIKIPLTYFLASHPIVTRTVFKALNQINATEDIERKHIDMILELSKAENGTKINLPGKLMAAKEYEYLTLVKHIEKEKLDVYSFKPGTTHIPTFGQILVKRTTNFKLHTSSMLIDAAKLQKGAVWRARQEGDTITKFGGGTKKLKQFLIEKKVPSRIRDFIPVLALGNDILAVATVDISDKVKIDGTTQAAYAVEFISELK